MTPTTRILQTFTATDWFAFFLLPAYPHYSLVRLVCWQLEEDLQIGNTQVVGMVASAIGGSVGRARDAEGFHMYAHEEDVQSGTLRSIIGRQREIYGPKA